MFINVYCCKGTLQSISQLKITSHDINSIFKGKMLTGYIMASTDLKTPAV